MFRHLSTKFFANDDKAGGVITPTREFNSENDVLDLLGESGDSDDNNDEDATDDKQTNEDREDDKEDKKSSKDREDKEEEEEVELKEEEVEDKLDIEEEPIDVPPRIKQLEKDYPGITKKYPYIIKLFARDRQYNEMFGSFDEARESHQKAELLDEFESDLMSGNSESLFSRIKDNDTKAFAKIANNLLPTLQKVDREAYLNVVSDVVERVIARMATEGKRLNNEQLQDAAVLVNQFVFGKSEFEPRRVEQESPKDEELERERASFEQERLTAAIQDVSTRVSNTLKNTITAYIDPKGEMTPFVKKHAISQALEYIDTSIANDREFRRQLDNHWKSSLKDKLSPNSKDKIRTVILGKSRTLLKTAITKARAEALKGNSKRSSDDSDNDRERNPIRREKHSTPQNRRGGKNEMQKGESVLDFLSRD